MSGGLTELCGCGAALERVDLSCNELRELPPQLGLLSLHVLQARLPP